MLKPLPRERLNSSSETPGRNTRTSLADSRFSVAPITSPGVSSLPGMSFNECMAACNWPARTASRISATKAPPLPPCFKSLLVWSTSPVVSNLTISTSMPGIAAERRRAISSVCTKAIALLRVPIRSRIATTEAPRESISACKPRLTRDADRIERADTLSKRARSGFLKLARVLQDHVGCFFRDHDDGRIGIPRNEVRHDRSVDHAQAFDAANGKPLVDDRERIISHPAGRCRMINGAAPRAAKAQQLRIAHDLCTGIDLLDDVGRKRRCGKDLSQYLQSFDIGGAIGLGRKIVDPDFRGCRGVGAADAKRATAFGAQLANRRCKAGKRMQPFSHFVCREWKKMNLNVGCRKSRVGLEERARRAGRNGQRTGPECRILHSRENLADGIVDDVV